MHMRKYILSLLILLLAAPITAQADNHAEKNSRYRGFVELGTSFNVGFYNPRGTGSISTTHGCQINSHLFVGAGQSDRIWRPTENRPKVGDEHEYRV